MPDTGPPQEGLGGGLPIHERVKRQRAHDDYIRKEAYDGGRLIGSKESYRPKKKSENNKFAGVGPRRIGNFKYSHAGAVKTEFLFGLVLLLLAPIGNPAINVDKAYAKRLVAFLLLFMGLFPMGASSNPEVSRLGSLLGGLILLSLMLVSHPTKGYALNFATLIQTIVAKLQPDSGQASASHPAPAPAPTPNAPKGWTQA